VGRPSESHIPPRMAGFVSGSFGHLALHVVEVSLVVRPGFIDCLERKGDRRRSVQKMDDPGYPFAGVADTPPHSFSKVRAFRASRILHCLDFVVQLRGLSGVRILLEHAIADIKRSRQQSMSIVTRNQTRMIR